MPIPSFLNDNRWCSGDVQDAAPIFLPTGRVVVSDPFLDPFNLPFDLVVAPGAYPVRFHTFRGEVGLVVVDFVDDLNEVTSWRTPEPSEFGVDSATGCIMDHKVCRYLRRRAADGKYEKYADRFERAMSENAGLWGNYTVDSESGANVILFQTFGGDGLFPCYLGLDRNGQAACLVIDMYFGEKGEEQEPN